MFKHLSMVFLLVAVVSRLYYIKNIAQDSNLIIKAPKFRFAVVALTVRVGHQIEALPGGEWDLVSKVITTLIRVVSMVTVFITLTTKPHVSSKE